MRSDHLNRHMKVHKKLCEDSLNSIYSSRASLDNESEFSSSETDWEAPVQKETPLEREAIIKRPVTPKANMNPTYLPLEVSKNI